MAFYRKNISSAHQVVRVVAGAGIVALAAFALAGPMALTVAAIGVVLAASGLVGYCPMCAIAGIGARQPGPR